MKKIIFRIAAIVAILALVVATFTGCNFWGYDFIDTNYHFNKAIVKMPDGSVEVWEIKKWSDTEGEQLTITTKDGTRYLVSSINCVLVEE
jgi:hypothetical protein